MEIVLRRNVCHLSILYFFCLWVDKVTPWVGVTLPTQQFMFYFHSNTPFGVTLAQNSWFKKCSSTTTVIKHHNYTLQ